MIKLTDRVVELEAENKQLRKDVKLEQDLRKNYHNEETARLREVIESMIKRVEMNGFGNPYVLNDARAALANKALEVNTTVDDPSKEVTNI